MVPPRVSNDISRLFKGRFRTEVGTRRLSTRYPLVTEKIRRGFIFINVERIHGFRNSPVKNFSPLFDVKSGKKINPLVPTPSKSIFLRY